MGAGSYSVIRSIPDPIKGEVLNIGVVVWDAEQFRIVIDEKAAQHAVNLSPFLPKDAWAYFEESLIESLVKGDQLDPDAVDAFVECPRSETLRLSRPAYARIANEPDGFDQRVTQLVKRLVERRPSGGGTFSPADDIKERVEPYIKSKRIHRNHPFAQTKSSVQRKCDFFVNSGANVALDALRLDLSKPRDAFDRVDIEAAKVVDVVGENPVRFLVYCQAGNVPHSAAVRDWATNVLSSVGAEVLFDAAEAAEILKREANHQEQQTRF